MSKEERKPLRYDERSYKRSNEDLLKILAAGKIIYAKAFPPTSEQPKVFEVSVVTTEKDSENAYDVRFPFPEQAQRFAEMIMVWRDGHKWAKNAEEEREMEILADQVQVELGGIAAGQKMEKGIHDVMVEDIGRGLTGVSDPAARGDSVDSRQPNVHGRHYSNKELQGMIDNLRRNYKGMPPIVLDPLIDSPARYTPSTDTVRVNPNKISSERELQFNVFHEVVGHRQVMEILGEDYMDFMLRVFRDLGKELVLPTLQKENSRIREVFRKAGRPEPTHEQLYIFDMSTPEGQIQAAEEFIALSSENGPIHRSMWERFKEWFRQLFRNYNQDIRLDVDDIGYLINKAFKHAKMPMNKRGRQRIRKARNISEDLNKLGLIPSRSDIKFEGRTPEQLAYLNKVSAIPQGNNYKEYKHFIKKGAIQKIFDSLHPIKDLVSIGAYKLARLSKRADGLIMTMLQYGGLQVKLSKIDDVFSTPSITVDNTLPGLFETLKPLGTEGERISFFAWMQAKRAEDLASKGKERWLDATEIKHGLSLDEGFMRDAVNNTLVQRNYLYNQIADQIDKYNASIVKIGIKFNVFDSKIANTWKTQWYVPFWREIDRQVGDTRGLKGPVFYRDLVDAKSPVYELKGADMALRDPFNNMIQNWTNIIDTALKNQAGIEVLNKASKMMDPESGANLVEPVKESSYRSVHVLDKGEKIYYHVNNQLLFEALTSMHQSDINVPGLKWAIKAKRLMTLGVTSTPDFKLRNAVRDTVTAAGTTEVGFNIFKNFFGGFKTLKDIHFKGLMLSSGGYMQFGYTRSDDRKLGEKLFKDAMGGGYILNNPEAQENLRQAMSRYGSFAKTIWSRYQQWGDKMENANRASLFKKAIAEGKSELEAGYLARDILDFSLQGGAQWVRVMNALVPFANAMIQSKYKTGRSIRDYPAAFTTVASAVIMASVFEWLMYQDDDDWKSREEWDKDTFHWFKIPGTNKAFRLPKAHEFSILGNFAWRSLDYAVGDDPANKEVLIPVMKNMLTREFGISPVPQIIAPAAEVFMDYDFFTGRPIEGMLGQILSPTERKRLHTSPAAVLSSRGLNAVGVPLSPIQIEHLVEGYFGMFGEIALFGGTLMSKPFYDPPVAPASKITDFPVAKTFMQTLPLRNTKYGNIIYQHFKNIEQAYADVSAARAAGDWERYRELRLEHKDLLRLSLIHI